MRMEQSLLEYLSVQMGCIYLSDLHFLSEGKRRILAQWLEQLEAREQDIREWNDALEYLTGLLPKQTSREAKSSLLVALLGM